MDKRIKITYCGAWGYKAKASSLEVQLKNVFLDAKIDLIESSGGIFIVEVNDKPIFNNKEEGVKFPDEADVIDRIRSL